MTWLTLATGTVTALDEDRRVLATIAQLARLLDQDDRGIAGERELSALLLRLTRDEPAIRKLLMSAIGDVVEEIAPDLDVGQTVDSLQRLARSMHERLKQLDILTCRWDRLSTDDCAGKERMLDWHGLDRLPVPDLAEAESVQVLVSGKAERGLRLEPVSATPPDLPASLGEAIGICLYGKIQAAAGASIPIRFGNVGLEAGGDAESRIDWYFRRSDHAFVAASVAQALGALGNPFDLHSLANALNGGTLVGVRLEADGGFGIGGSLEINALDAILGPVGATLGAQLSFHSTRRGGFLVDIYSTPDPLNGRLAVRADIHRTKLLEDTTGATVGLTLDLSRALSDLRSVLLDDERVKGARNLLKRFERFIPPSEHIRGRLGKALEEQIESAELRGLLEAVLGSSSDASATDRLRQRLTAAIDSRADLWQAQAAELASDAARKAIDDLALGQTERNLLRRIASLAVEDSLQTLRADLDDEVARQMDSNNAVSQLEHILDQAEASLTEGFRRADSLAERVKAQIDRLQQVQSAIARALAHSGEVKLNARWRSEERRSEGSSIEQSLLFRPEHSDAADLFKRALTGSLDDIFKRFAGGEGNVDEGPVMLISGTLQEFAGVSRESGVEIALLSFQLQGFSLLDANVSIETDSAGNIRVCTKQSSRRIAGTSSEREVFEAINVFELASAKQTRRMSLSLSLSQIHKKLKDNEIDSFFGGLTHGSIGLLTKEQVEAASAKIPREDERSGCELRAWMELNEAQLRRFLHLPPAGAELRPEALKAADARKIYEKAIDAMLAGLQVPEPGADYWNLKHFLKSDPKGPLMDVWVKSQIRKYQPHPGDVTVMDTETRDFERFRAVAERAHGLVRTIRSMREIYFSKPGPNWTPDIYRNRQEQINDDIIGWVRGELADFVRRIFGKDAINPYMLAYFKVVAELAKAPSRESGVTPLLASIVMPGTAAGGDETEVMLVETPAPALAPPTPPPPLRRRRMPAQPPPADPTTGPEPIANGNNVQRTNAMPPLIYPLEDKERTRTYHKDGRQFNASRGSRRHAGCDMLAPKGTRIRAMADGKVIRPPYHFYEGTYAIEIEHPQPSGDSLLIRYGEVGKGIPKNIKSGARVKQGDIIAYVGKLKRSSMLHMEMYKNGSDHRNLTGSSKFRRRGDLIDPTKLLDEAPAFTEAPQRSRTRGGDDTTPELRKWEGIVDANKIAVLLNVRKAPRIIAGEDPVTTLAPNAQIEVLAAVTGDPRYSRHPFGNSNLWFKIRIPSDEKPRYVIAYFIKTDMPVLGLSGTAGLPTTGHVSGVRTILNIRSGPSLGANVLYTLPVDTAVTILSEHTGDEYSPERNDWVKIRTSGKNDGFAAAFYISPGEKEEQEEQERHPGSDMGEWERVLVENDWPGRKSGGRAASEEAARFDVDIVKRLVPVFQGVANKFSIPAALLAGIASRESGCGRLLRDGMGDGGNAFGIMQVDKRYHTIHNRSEPAGHEHIEQAAGIFCDFLDGVCRKKPGWSKRSQLHGATAAYNFGLKHVKNEDKIDIGTAHDDYGGDTLARAKFFYNHRDLPALR